MKKILALTAGIMVFASVFAEKIAPDTESARKSFGSEVTVTPADGTVTVTKDRITLAAKKEGVTYTISGYFSGQVVNKTKNTVIKLKGAYLENPSGEAAVYGEAKTEISTAKGTINYVVSGGNGESGAKNGAIQCKKDIVLGGSGTLYATGNACHAVKGDDIKIKGSGKFYLRGTKKGSAINCATLTVEKEKTFSAYLADSKNGIKADETILIQSGNFYLSGNETALKTDTRKEDPKRPHGITLAGGTFRFSGNKNLYETEKNAYKPKGAKITEE